MLRLVSVVALAACLTGCGTMPFDYEDSYDTPKTATGSLATSIPPSQAMAVVPIAAGQVVSVIERKRGNALQHEITLYGAPPNFGSNQVIVTAFKYIDSSPEKPVEDTLTIAKPTEDDIYKEMQERIPGGALPVSNNVPRNGMGAFGYAYGRRNNANCIYAWQWIDAGFRPFNMVANKTTAPVSVRVRICRPGMTEEVMVDFIRQMYVQPRPYGGASDIPRGPMAAANPYGGNPYGAPAGYGAGYGANPYVTGYSYPPQQAAPAPERKVAAAPVVRRKTIRRAVRRRVVAPQIYSYTPPAQVRTMAPAAQVAPVAPAPSSTGYSTVPMPQ